MANPSLCMLIYSLGLIQLHALVFIPSLSVFELELCGAEYFVCWQSV